MTPIRFRIRTIMIVVAVTAAVMSVVRIALAYPRDFAVVVPTLGVFCPTLFLLLLPFALDRYVKMRSRAMSKSTSADKGLSRNERASVRR
jgi:hypothetical protein